jgi:ribonuclease HI
LNPEIRKQLKSSADLFAARLEKAGYSSAVEGYYDYQVKLAIRRGGGDCGCANIWYSPKKDKFSLTVSEMTDRTSAEAVKALWEGREREKFHEENDLKGWHLFVDGSHKDGRIRWAFLAVKDNAVMFSASGDADEPEFAEMRNILGEIRAVEHGIRRLAEEKAKEVTVHYDYAGLEHWARGEWKTNNELTRQYRFFFGDLKMTVHWNKVEGHSGHFYNELADKLAGQR